MNGRIFYRVEEKHGINCLQMPRLLTQGRIIRWRSTGAEYGLVEAVVCEGMGEVNVRDASNGRTGEIYFEQVAEICLTREEASRFGFSYPC